MKICIYELQIYGISPKKWKLQYKAVIQQEA